MKPRGVLSGLSDVFNPAEVRRARRLQKQWDELDDVASIIGEKNTAHKLQEREEEEIDKLRAELNLLLDRVVSDVKRVKDIVNQLTAS